MNGDARPTDGAEEEPEPPAAKRSVPTALPGILVVFASIVGVLAALTTWVRVQALDTDEWVTLSSELLDEEEIRSALAVHLTDALYTRIDVSGRFEELLPEDLERLAPLVSGALRGPTIQSVERLLDSDRFRAGWAGANRVAHRTMVAILRDETRASVSTAGGAVTLELRELVRAVGDQLGLPTQVLDELPEDAGRITVFESDQLDRAQTLIRVLDALSWFLLLLVVAAYATAVYLAGGRRLQVLRWVGTGLVVAGATVLLAQAVSVRIVIGAIVEQPSREPLANVAAFVGTRLLRQIAWSYIVYGVIVLLFTALMGERPRAVAARRTLAPVIGASAGAVAGGTVLAVLFLLWWSPGRAFDRWPTAVIAIALIVGAVVALRTRTLHDRADARGVETADASEAGPTPAGTRFWRALAPRPADALAAQLAALSELHDQGALDDGEFAAAKQRLLASTPDRPAG